MTVKIFTTGGTMDKVYFDRKSDYQVGDPQAENVLARANVALEYEVVPLLRKDSLDMTDEDRCLIHDTVAADAATCVVITHGTDTMVETAKTLLDIQEKTIVLTGSMYPAQFRESDAVFNLGCAITAAQTLPAGVYLAMNGCIFDPTRTAKNIAANRFEELS